MKKIFSSLLIVFIPFYVYSYNLEISTASFYAVYKFEDKILKYNDESLFASLKNIPGDEYSFVKYSLSSKNLSYIAYITLSTLLLMRYDREIYKETQRFAKRLNISQKDNTKTFVSFKKIAIFRGPTDTGSFMYFLGDGWITIGLACGFKTYGIMNDNLRAKSVSNQLIEGLLLTGFTTQFLKWASGREMPKVSSCCTGLWRPFRTDYIKNRKFYDAFPSGHMASSVMTLTVISENYPEKEYIKPAGYFYLV